MFKLFIALKDGKWLSSRLALFCVRDVVRLSEMVKKIEPEASYFFAISRS